MSSATRDYTPPPYSLIPPDCIRRVAKVYAEGKIKYGPHDWRKGQPYSVVIDHAMDHLIKYQEGKRNEDHLAKVVWAMFALMYYDTCSMPSDIDWSCDVHI